MRRLSAFILAAALGAGFAVPSPAGAYTPHVLRFATAEEIATLNPDINQQVVVTYLSQMTSAFLFRYDRDYAMHPELATEVPTTANGGISKDGLAITFHLRHGVKWSDGAPFDADDVVWTVNAMNNAANLVPSRDGFDQIVKMDEPDKFTVTIHLKRRYGAIVGAMFGSAAGTAVLPKHILGSLPDFNKAPFNALPVGIGPFRYAAWRRGDAIELERNPYYWRGQPALAGVVMKIVPNRTTVQLEMGTGELDMWFGVTGAALPALAQMKNVTVLRHPGFGINQVYFNMRDPIVGDVVVRRALRYAMDRRSLREKIGNGVGVLQDMPLPLTAPGSPHDTTFTDYDPAKARAILDAAGWKVGADGVRAKNGTRLTIDFASGTGLPDIDRAIELIRTDWKDVGIEMTVNRYQSSMLFGPMDQGGILLNGKFSAMFLGRVNSLPLDPRGTFGCAEAPPAGQNAQHYCNPKVDALIDKLDVTYDESARNAYLRSIYALIAADIPTLVTTGGESISAFNSNLKNFNPNSATPFDDMMRVDLP